MRGIRLGVGLASAALVMGLVAAVSTLGSASATAPAEVDHAPVSVLSMSAPTAYTPQAINGGTDDYHCTLVNPHVTKNSYIVGSQFFPGTGPSSVEVHHAILFLVPPSMVSAAEAANAGGKGWTCFGEPPVVGSSESIRQLLDMPWLSAWAPGHGKDVMPLTTGTPLAKGSLVIEQVHYNLLVGDKPVKTSVKLYTVPASTHLRPASLQPLIAIPNIPCAAGVTGSLCNRTAELANLAKRFGGYQVLFDDFLTAHCGENPQNPPVGDSTSCVSQIYQPGYITRAIAHMHLLGQTMRITLNPGTPQAKTILWVPNYNFHYQRAYNLKKWIKVSAGETVKVTCTYNPSLEQELPALRRIPPHFVTWGDGSSDEMCLGLIGEVPLDPHAPTEWQSSVGSSSTPPSSAHTAAASKRSS